MNLSYSSFIFCIATHKIHAENECFYFLTFTCYKWYPLLKLTEIDDYFSLWMSRLNDKGILISAFVMMPNHLHLLVFVDNSCTNFNLIIGEAKRFMAYEIVKRLKAKGENSILKKLRDGVQLKEGSKGKRHQVFRLSFDAKKVIGLDSLNRVADYIHHNPVSGKWHLVADYTDYSLSSAAYYHLGKINPLIKADFRVYSPLDLRVSFDNKSQDDSERVYQAQYHDNFVYKNGLIDFISNEEGRVVLEDPNVESEWEFRYEYLFMDQVGNVRLRYSDLDRDGCVDPSEILEENSYYPYGLKHLGLNHTIVGAEMKFRFNSKEFNDESVDLDNNNIIDGYFEEYDNGARMFDPSIARWNVVDPISETQAMYSPYHFTYNNPISYSDPTGLEGDDVKKKKKVKNPYTGVRESPRSEGSSSNSGDSGNSRSSSDDNGTGSEAKGGAYQRVSHSSSNNHTSESSNKVYSSNQLKKTENVNENSHSSSDAVGTVGITLGVTEELLSQLGKDKIKLVVNESGKILKAEWDLVSTTASNNINMAKTTVKITGFAVSGIMVGLDGYSLSQNKISGYKFGYRTVGNVSAATAAVLLSSGGIGAIVSGSFIMGEIAYDSYMKNIHPEIIQGYRDFRNGLDNGWRPFR